MRADARWQMLDAGKCVLLTSNIQHLTPGLSVLLSGLAGRWPLCHLVV